MSAPTLPTNDDMLADAGRLLAAVLRSMFDGYKQRYRAFVVAKIAGRRDSYKKGTPEWKALDQLLQDLGAAQRDPEAAPPDMPEQRSAA